MARLFLYVFHLPTFVLSLVMFSLADLEELCFCSFQGNQVVACLWFFVWMFLNILMLLFQSLANVCFRFVCGFGHQAQVEPDQLSLLSCDA